MSIYAISCRIATKRLGGIVPSTSAGIILNFPSTIRWKNFDNRCEFSSDTLAIATELQVINFTLFNFQIKQIKNEVIHFIIIGFEIKLTSN